MTTVQIGEKLVGDGQPCYIIAEIGINHNGDLEIARRLIEAAMLAGCQAVKFQKRTVDAVYSQVELERPRESPFGKTNGALKHGLEFSEKQYDIIDKWCAPRGIHWFASPWDVESVAFLSQYQPVAYKIASACLTDDELLSEVAKRCVPVFLSTGMSTLKQIDHAVYVLGKAGAEIILMHCVSTYPASDADLNLRCISMLAERYGVPVGYSGHEIGLATTLAAVAMGACAVERHVTVDRSMWGSDQAASIEPHALMRLVRDIRVIEEAMGDGVKKVLDAEVAIQKKLRRVG